MAARSGGERTHSPGVAAARAEYSRVCVYTRVFGRARAMLVCFVLVCVRAPTTRTLRLPRPFCAHSARTHIRRTRVPIARTHALATHACACTPCFTDAPPRPPADASAAGEARHGQRGSVLRQAAMCAPMGICGRVLAAAVPRAGSAQCAVWVACELG